MTVVEQTDSAASAGNNEIQLERAESEHRPSSVMKQTFCVFNRARESFLSLSVTRADTQFARLKGLLGRVKLRSDEGLWTVPSQGIHTICMLFPIDLIYLDSENRVVHLIEDLGTFRITRIRRDSHSVLQLRTRTIYSSNTQVGDELLICSPEEIERFCKQKHFNQSVKWVSPVMFPNVFKGGLQRFQDRRRAARIGEPAIAAFYWDGSIPLSHRVRDISRMGIYLYTAERWYPGTILRLTLDAEQTPAGEMAANTAVESITLWSKVVRHGPDGVGLEFLIIKPKDREKLVHLLDGVKRGISEKSNA